MDKLENKVQELFNKPDWTDQEWELFVELLERQPEAMQYVFQENFIDKLQDSDSQNSDKARQLLHQIHMRTGINNQSAKIWSIKRLPFIRVAAAAVIVLLLSVGGYFYFNKSDEKQIAKTDTTEPLKTDVAPGGNKAILTLADGSQIILDSVANGTVAQQGNTKIIKLNNGELAYNATAANDEVLYNTISTPKGGQYLIVLADGSKVWLNAASSLRFPATFTGKERNVELTGEGYFEVAKNAAMPFSVKVNDMQVEVLGTHFNINAYNDEATIKTTLLEGSVKVQSTVLKPGQQAQLEKNSSAFRVVRDINVDEAVAWKNGYFYFNAADIQTIMRQVSRWYDVEVVYEGKIPSGHYKGKPSRNLTAVQMLKVVEESGVNFRIEGKKIIVKN